MAAHNLFDAGVKRTMEQARKAALERGDEAVDARHLLVGLLTEEEQRDAGLRAVGLDADAVRQVVTEKMGSGSAAAVAVAVAVAEHRFSQEAKKTLEKAAAVAADCDTHCDTHIVKPVHLLVALLESGGHAAAWLAPLGADAARMRATLKEGS
jgi:ATP-dependent Clp protease ATP-binding subunit ClpA